MRRKVDGVTESLMDNALNEFLIYGFKDASVRRIAVNSGVSTNSIYTRFGDKKGLFNAIVENAANGLMDIYMESIKRAATSDMAEDAIHEGDDGTDKVLSYIFEYREIFRLIFCYSAGTDYENFFDRLAGIEEQYYREFAGKYSSADNNVDDFFIHVYCRMGWQHIYEILTHDKTYEEAKAYMENVRIFNLAGWKALFGI